MTGARHFGRIGGTDVLEVTLATQAGAEARVITWGAVLRDLVVPSPSGPRPVVLGFDRLEEYLAYSPYFGAIVGRYANRIGGARFRLGGRESVLVPNEGRNQLHGGPAGFSKRVWSLLSHDGGSAHLALISQDGDMGYPGRLFATCSYELFEPATLRISLQAFTDAPTPVNLTTHSYYNLDGSADIRSHRLTIAADHVTPTDRELIPTGAIAAVAETRFDFRNARPIRTRDAYEDYDTNFVLSRDRDCEPHLAHGATLEADGLAMELWTSEPGLQFYDGHLIDIPVLGSHARPFAGYGGLALEPQRFPDGPNQPHFPPCILQPGQVSRQQSEFRFSPAQT